MVNVLWAVRAVGKKKTQEKLPKDRILSTK
jgi:hypothetical protein